jgi:NADH-quinone oxidoreductase subunit M
VGIFFAGLGLPGLCGFIGEVLVVLSVYKFNVALAVISAAVVILTAGYILWAIQRVYLGAEYKGPHPEALTPLTFREFWIAAPLLALAIYFGVNPKSLLNYMDKSVNKTVIELTEWKKRDDQAAAAKPATAENTVKPQTNS